MLGGCIEGRVRSPVLLNFKGGRGSVLVHKQGGRGSVLVHKQGRQGSVPVQSPPRQLRGMGGEEWGEGQLDQEDRVLYPSNTIY